MVKKNDKDIKREVVTVVAGIMKEWWNVKGIC